MKYYNKRLSLLKAIIGQFLILSTLVRFALLVWSYSKIDFSVLGFLRTMFTGLFFDIGVISFFIIIYILYLLIFPNRWVGNLFDKIFSYLYFIITSFIFLFSFLAEFTFWEEFHSRFNFIAVDYLIYTYEVVENINQSYPLPLLFSFIFILFLLLFVIQIKRQVFVKTFSSIITSGQRRTILFLLLIPLFYSFLVSNNDAEHSTNRYENELSKAGIYSFFAAFRSNNLSYTDFYKTQDIDTSFQILRKNLSSPRDSFLFKNIKNISRLVKNKDTLQKPNVVFVCIESLSVDFLTHFGNSKNLTPVLDSLLTHSIFFENIYATGTRTVRGMEAIILSTPPSPGRSIVKRQDNKNMNTIGVVFEKKGYSRTFFYGGDGYFDNMNQFFGSNGFDIVDRGRGYLFGDSFTAKRTNIENDEVVFENAWGICDEDIYNKAIEEADRDYLSNTPFFHFIMTTSNHRPYTYPENKIDIPSGTGREGAVKYTDYAIGEFLKKAETRPWYDNTVFVIMADHCANSAGKWELDVKKYHIPALIYNLQNHPPEKITVQCSQVDIFPTLFSYLNWDYESHFYGKDVRLFSKNDGRSFIGNYRKLGLLKGNTLGVLGDKKKFNYYTWDKSSNTLNPINPTNEYLKEIISYYQTNDYLYQNGLMKSKETP